MTLPTVTLGKCLLVFEMSEVLHGEYTHRLSSVDSLMAVEGRSVVEFFPAFAAFVRLLP